MTSEYAHQLSGWMVDHTLCAMGVKDGAPVTLKGVSLADMIEAKRIIEAENQAAMNAPGPHAITMVCDDRLIAALYTAYNYRACEPDDIEPIATTADGRMLIVVDRRCERKEAEA